MTMADVHMLGVPNVVTDLNYEQVVPRDVIVALSDSSIRVYFVAYFVNELLG